MSLASGTRLGPYEIVAAGRETRALISAFHGLTAEEIKIAEGTGT